MLRCQFAKVCTSPGLRGSRGDSLHKLPVSDEYGSEFDVWAGMAAVWTSRNTAH